MDKVLLSIRRSVTAEEREGPWLIVGQLYKGYMGFMLSLRVLTVNLWIHKWEDGFPRIPTIFLGFSNDRSTPLYFGEGGS